MPSRYVLLIILSLAILLAQPYTYEVVSIRPAAPGQQNSGFGSGAQGGLRVRNKPTMELLAFAYDAKDYQFVGAPSWAQSDRFDVNLTPEKSEPALTDQPTRPEVESWLNRNRQRMQAVLRDRFGLVLRKDTRELPMYALTIAKKGTKLVPADHTRPISFNINGDREIIAKSSSMRALADALSTILGRYVNDETGLEGSFDFKLQFEPYQAAATDDTGGASIFSALVDQLGLRLESKKGPVPVYIVEKIQKPSEN
jgi:uncharacterized protein (TIGR03435 family)